MAIRKRTGKRGVTWQIDYVDPTGKRVRRNFKKKKDAVAELGKRQSLMAEGSYLDHKKICDVTLEEMVKIYTRKYGDQASFQGTKARWLENFKDYFGKGTFLDKIKYIDVDAYQNEVKARLTRQGTIRKDSSVNKEVSCLRHMFTWAVQLDIIDKSPFANKESLWIKENNQRSRYLEQDEIGRLLSTTMPEWCKNVIVGILHTGMRRQEVLGLQWPQVRDGFVYLHKTKTNEARQIPVDLDLTAFLKALKHKHGLKSKYVFPDPDGDSIKGDSFSNALESATRRANVDDCTAHTLRHTFASHFVMRGGDLPSLRKILGHKDITMTMRYAHLAPDYLKKSIEAMNGLTNQKSDEKVTFNSHKEPIVSIASNA